MSTSDKIRNKSIIDEMSNSFLDYAMSVIVSRALPDVRDGLKPVHRRIIYAMTQINNYADKPYKKSARIVGDVIGKYHPHGDIAVYDAMVRMAQDFAFRAPLVDGHGNFGSIDGDGAAAMRYTEARMSKLAMELIKDINKDTIDFAENYDGNELEPTVLPAKYPNLLVNGTNGIAVGMATSIPPHNLGEVIDATIAMLHNPEIDDMELFTHIKGPDFPLGGQILGDAGFKKAYATGNGSVKVRSKYTVIDMDKHKQAIIISEIPYQVNKAVLVEKIAECAKNKRVDGITDLRDESDRDGIRIVIELRKGVSPDVIINNLFKFTQLESSFSFNMLALVDGEPKILKLKEILFYYIRHQVNVIERRTRFDLNKAEERIHILEGLKIAVDNIDQVIKIIRSSKDTATAAEGLSNAFELSDRQVKAILEMRLQKLTGLEIDKLASEIDELMLIITDLRDILANPVRVNQIIESELQYVKDKYNTPRRSEVIEGYFDSGMDYEELIEEEDVVVMLTSNGYVKRSTPSDYRVQNRGGKGLKGMNVNDEDTVTHIITASTHSDLLFFTDQGKVFRTRTHKVPNASRTAKGIPIVNLIDIEKEDKITNIITIKEYEDDMFLLFVTNMGIGKKTALTEYVRVNKNGKKAITLQENDEVNSVLVCKNEDKILIASHLGKAILANIEDFRAMGRMGRGVRALRFSSENDYVVEAGIVQENSNVLTVTTKGFGKLTSIDKYRVQKRGGKGTKNVKLSDKNGVVSSIKILSEDEILTSDLIIISENGQVIRVSVNNISRSGRDTQGVRIMRLPDEDYISTTEIIPSEEEELETEINLVENEKNISVQDDEEKNTILEEE
ncbi:MAG: DNA gyrase subunit A [Mycoplasmatales bacterium]